MDNRLNSLFKPINIGGLTARNRIVMPPMNTNLAHGDGFVDVVVGDGGAAGREVVAFGRGEPREGQRRPGREVVA